MLTIPLVKIVSPPISEVVPYASECRLDAVCANEACSVSVLIDSAADLHFVSSLLYDNLETVSAITLVWTCPICDTINSVEEWVLAEAHLPTWPPPLTRSQADLNPASEMISRQTRIEALARYDTGTS